MNYHLLEYSELKQEARERRIKMYYVMRKAQLVYLLSMKELPERYIVEKKKIGELKAEARARGIPQVYLLHRQALVDLLYPNMRNTSPYQEDQYHNSTKKHDNP
jgi:hypothetical protein